MLPANYTEIHGWCTVEKANKLMEIVDEIAPKICVELGVFGGRSLLPIALAAKKFSSKVFGIDAWCVAASIEGTNDKANTDWWAAIDYDFMYKYTVDLMVKNDVDVKLIRNSSLLVYTMFADESIDLFHQDSNHSAEITCQEIELYFNKIRIGGLWIFDDINWPTTQEAAKLLVIKGYEKIFTSEDGGWAIFKRLPKEIAFCDV